jgi:hypothetical protein
MGAVNGPIRCPPGSSESASPNLGLRPGSRILDIVSTVTADFAVPAQTATSAQRVCALGRTAQPFPSTGLDTGEQIQTGRLRERCSRSRQDLSKAETAVVALPGAGDSQESRRTTFVQRISTTMQGTTTSSARSFSDPPGLVGDWPNSSSHRRSSANADDDSRQNARRQASWTRVDWPPMLQG